MAKNPVVHFEMPASDIKRVSEFYTNVFGWEMKPMGADMGNYVVATTTESDDRGPKKPGAINGGFFLTKDGKPEAIPSVVIQVADIREYMKKAEAAGGKVLGEPTDIPGVGLYVSIEDSEKNKVSLLQSHA
jgi:predicted enzyme related to lactoylglutathione lyase